MQHRFRFLSTLVTALALQGEPAVAQPAATFFSKPSIEEATLSPSGRQLAITSNKGLNRTGLAIIDLEKGSSFARVAQFGNGDICDVHWLSDTRLVFTLAGIATGPRGFAASTAMYSVNSDGSELHRLMLGNLRVLHVPEPVADQDNERILVETVTSTHGYGQTRPAWLDTRSGRIQKIELLNAPPHASGWSIDGRGEPRVAFTHDKYRQSAYWRTPGSTDWARLYEVEMLNLPFGIAGVDDSGTLYVTRTAGAEGYEWLTRYDFKTGKPEDGFIIKTPGFDFRGSLIPGASGGTARGVRLWLDGETTFWFDPKMKALQAEADRLLVNRVNRIDCRRCGEADMVALVRSYSDRDPGRLFIYQAKPPEGESNWRSVGAVRENIQPEEASTMELHRIRARDGRDLPVWVTRPAGARAALPTVVWVHNGPWQRGRYWGWHALPQFFASQGFVVIEPEMRGSTGFGAAHFTAGFKQWGQAMQNDVADALRWAQTQGMASTAACIAGEGYGGYSALMGLVNDPDLFRCGVAGFAPTDLALLVQGAWWTDDGVHHQTRRYALPDLVGDAVADAAMLHSQSPVNQAARVKAPVMLAFNEKGGFTPHGERMRKALRDAGNDPVWVTYAGSGHGVATRGDRLDFATRTAAFLNEHLNRAPAAQAP